MSHFTGVKNREVIFYILLDKADGMCYLKCKILTLSVLALRERCEHSKETRKEAPFGLFTVAASAGWRHFLFGGKDMDTRVAVMSIIVENADSVEKVNSLLHEYGEYIIGRMGIPYRKRKISIISIALDAPQNTISALAGKIGSLEGISVKTAYSGVTGTN